jgi:hypothetical protein
MITKTNNRTRLSVSGVEYDFDFRIDATTELEVYGIDADGDATELTTGFTVSFSAEDEEGTVTFDAEPSTYSEILMLRNRPYTQDTDIPIRGGFSEEDIEGALDAIVIEIQQLKELVDSAVKQDSTAVQLDIVLPTPEDGLALAWDGTDGTMRNLPVDTAGLANAQAAAEAAQAAAEAAQAAAEAALAAVLAGSRHPVGTVITLGVATNPATLFGYGTWTAIAGKVIVGIDAGQTEFDTLNETGGAKTHTLITDEIPAHTHSVQVISGGSDLAGGANYVVGTGATGSTGGGGAHNNLQPYIVKYVWERTA